jgi:CheY-like chemotaxis protein
VINARDAMPDGGEIHISARREEATAGQGGHGLAPGSYVVLGVADEGEGMDEATLARATEPFFTTKGVGKGTGLGLSMAYGLAAQSGGRLVLKSRKGEGTVAEIWLPVAAGAPGGNAPGGGAPAEVPAIPTSSARRLRVLLVDDDPLVLASTSGMLDDLGHEVVEAESGEQALACIRDGVPPDVVVTDYGMPGMTGLELAEALRRELPRLAVVVATGYDDTPDGGLKGVTTLRKPFGQHALGIAIEDSLAGR